jgi:hypothetical protein
MSVTWFFSHASTNVSVTSASPIFRMLRGTLYDDDNMMDFSSRMYLKTQRMLLDGPLYNSSRHLMMMMNECTYVRKKCPACMSDVKIMFPHTGHEVEDYWQWVHEVKPVLPQSFEAKFRVAAKQLEKKYRIVPTNENVASSSKEGSIEPEEPRKWRCILM